MTPIAQVVVLLSAAVITVPLLKRFGLASVMGYLVAGVVIAGQLVGLRVIFGAERVTA